MVRFVMTRSSGMAHDYRNANSDMKFQISDIEFKELKDVPPNAVSCSNICSECERKCLNDILSSHTFSALPITTLLFTYWQKLEMVLGLLNRMLEHLEVVVLYGNTGKYWYFILFDLLCSKQFMSRKGLYST